MHKWMLILAITLLLVVNPAFAQEQQTLLGHTEPVTSLAFSPDGALLASGGDDISLRLWRVTDGEHIIALYPHNNVVKGVAFNPDGLLASTSWDRSVVLTEIDLEAEEPAIHLETWGGYSAVIEPVAFSPGGEWVAFGVGDGTIPLVDVATQETDTTFTIESLQVLALAFSPDGQHLAATAGFPEDRIYLWDVDDRTTDPLTFTGHEGAITGLAFSPLMEAETVLLVSVGADGRMALWERSEAGEVMQVGGASLGEDVWFTSVAFHPDELIVATGMLDGTITLWDVTQADAPEQLTTYTGHNGPVNALAFSPDGALLASGGDDTTIRLWPLDAQGSQ